MKHAFHSIDGGWNNRQRISETLAVFIDINRIIQLDPRRSRSTPGVWICGLGDLTLDRSFEMSLEMS